MQKQMPHVRSMNGDALNTSSGAIATPVNEVGEGRCLADAM